jgi:D-glycero-D-manno-heptose 1,7-bisphosphate phosphatase
VGNSEGMGSSVTSKLRAVLFDRDGTLVVDVPYNGDPGLVTPMPGAKEVLDALRADGIATGVISNQSGIACTGNGPQRLPQTRHPGIGGGAHRRYRC